MKMTIDVSNECPHCWTPKMTDIQTWLQPVLELTATDGPCALSLRYVSEPAGAKLNARYRGKDAATNVLSFPAELPAGIRKKLKHRPLGDIVLCPAIIAREAEQQGKDRRVHWAHMLQHGLLHLLGYDHADEAGAREMEALEIRALQRLGIANPYLVG